MGIDIFGTKNDTFVSWQASPDTRGTWSLLISCLATIFLCMYTAVHINIPEAGDNQKPWYFSQALRSKVGCLILGVLMPEIMLFVAFQQYREAGEVARIMNKSRQTRRVNTLDATGVDTDTKAKKKKSEWKQKWTRRQGFFVVMGGLCFDVSDQLQPFIATEPKGWADGSRKRRYVLNFRGLKLLAAHFPELIPDIPLEDLDDRSKSNAIGKAITLLQGLWFCVQTISRLADHLPISLLELNTLGHATCALVMFLFWLDKPYDVTQHTVIDGPGKLRALAYLSLQRFAYSDHPQQKLNGGLPVFPYGVTAVTDETFDKTSQDKLPQIDIWSGNTLILPSDACIPGTKLKASTSTNVSMRPELVRCSQLAWQFWVSRGGRSEDNQEKKIVGKDSSSPLVDFDRLPTFVSSSFWGGGNIAIAFFSCFCSSLLYGGLHALAWNAPFESQIEQHLWRIATITVIVGISAIGFSLIVLPWSGQLFGFLFFLIAIMYAIARSYLVVESFVSLRHVPHGVYTNPQFSRYPIPHI